MGAENCGRVSAAAEARGGVVDEATQRWWIIQAAMPSTYMAARDHPAMEKMGDVRMEEEEEEGGELGGEGVVDALVVLLGV